jgi:hypothetical protein
MSMQRMKSLLSKQHAYSNAWKGRPEKFSERKRKRRKLCSDSSRLRLVRRLDKERQLRKGRSELNPSNARSQPTPR